MNRIRILTAADLARALPMKAAIAAMEEAFALPSDCVDSPARSHLSIPEARATFLLMPSFASPIPAFGAKLVGVFPGNPASGIDRIQAAYLLFSKENGRLLSIMDGKYLTAVRTAATTAVATRRMSPEGPARLALFGTGSQAQAHLAALAEVCQLAEARVCGSTREKSARFCRDVRPVYRFPVEPFPPEAAVESADVVCTCTSSPTPVFPGRRLRPGCHVSAIGAFQPETRELDEEVFEDARVVVDTMEGAMSEAGDILIPLSSGRLRREQIVGDLGQLVRGEIQARHSLIDRTVFKSVGWALEDLLAASHAYHRSRDQGIGLEADL